MVEFLEWKEWNKLVKLLPERIKSGIASELRREEKDSRENKRNGKLGKLLFVGCNKLFGLMKGLGIWRVDEEPDEQLSWAWVETLFASVGKCKEVLVERCWFFGDCLIGLTGFRGESSYGFWQSWCLTTIWGFSEICRVFFFLDSFNLLKLK